VAVFTALLAVFVTVGVGLLPAIKTESHTGDEPLRAGRTSVQRAGTRRLQRALVVAEVALTIVPLIAAGLMVRTFLNLTQAPLGFDPNELQTAKIAVSFRLFPDLKQRLQLHFDALDNLRRIRGVESVSLASPLPFTENVFTRNYGRTSDPTPLIARATLQTIFPGYMNTSGVSLIAGRDFTDDDLINERDVVIIDERIAKQLWPGDAIGQQLAVSRGRDVARLDVIGVTNSVRLLRVRDEAMPHLFVPYHFFPLEMGIVAKTVRSSESIGPELKRAVESLGTRRPVYDVRSMRSYVDQSIGDARFTMLVLVGFAGASLLLSAVGLYGTLAYLTSQRSKEFGVRMALGATTGRIVRSVAGEGLLLTISGSVAGLAGAAAVTSLLQDLLYGVQPFDSATVAATAVVMAVVALAATAHPAWRAAQIDPMTTLRAD
jgi:putative ABC transport system permease protein